MQSSIERRRLLKAMNEGPVYARLTLAKCAAGLAAVALIAVIGAQAPINIATPTRLSAAAKGAAGAHENMRSQPHRKQVFDERRVRFGGGASRHSVAREAVEPDNQLPLALR